MLISKSIAPLVNKFMPQDYKTLVKPQKINQNFIWNYEIWDSSPKKKNMSDHFETNFLFIGLHLIVKEVCH